MRSKISTLAAAAAIALGTAGLATTASAMGMGAGDILAETSKSSSIQNAYHYGYPGYRGHGRRRMCRRLYRLGFIRGVPWARRAYYRRGCQWRYRPYRPYYRSPAFGFRLSF